jgi:hypothetical protein
MQSASLSSQRRPDEQSHLVPQPRRRQGGRPDGQHGENGGPWFGLHMIAVDSKGTIYTGEVFASERVQRFLPVR